jgi:hypothetical protein
MSSACHHRKMQLRFFFTTMHPTLGKIFSLHIFRSMHTHFCAWSRLGLCSLFGTV